MQRPKKLEYKVGERNENENMPQDQNLSNYYSQLKDFNEDSLYINNDLKNKNIQTRARANTV